MSVEPRNPNLPAHSGPGGPPSPPKHNLRGRKKAAVLLVSLGSDRAADVFRHLRDEEIESLSLEMAKLQRVDPSTTEGVLAELAATCAGLRVAHRRRRRVRA